MVCPVGSEGHWLVVAAARSQDIPILCPAFFFQRKEHITHKTVGTSTLCIATSKMKVVTLLLQHGVCVVISRVSYLIEISQQWSQESKVLGMPEKLCRDLCCR